MLENAPTPAGLHGKTSSPSLRRTLFRLLETADQGDVGSRAVDIALVVLISTSVLAVILESIPSINQAYGPWFYWFEVLSVAVFSVEYVLRIWASVEDGERGSRQPFRHRLRFMVSFHAIIDLLAILPFYLLTFGLLGNLDMRFLRAVRLVRVLKLTRYFASLNMLIIAMKENGRALGSAFVILLTTMLLAASGMYYFERVSQPEDFGSIPAAMWWAFATLTTVGYGDVTPVTVGGKVFGALITVVGIGMVALPTSILASGYSQQLNLSANRYRNEADQALDDGVLTDDEVAGLEALRLDLGLGEQAASQILQERTVRMALSMESERARCPHCNEVLPKS